LTILRETAHDKASHKWSEKNTERDAGSRSRWFKLGYGLFRVSFKTKVLALLITVFWCLNTQQVYLAVTKTGTR